LERAATKAFGAEREKAMQVTIYTKSWCPHCQRAKALLAAKGVDFREYDVEQDGKALAEMLERSGGRRTVPQVFIGEVHVGGNDDLQALEARGALDALLRRGED